MIACIVKTGAEDDIYIFNANTGQIAQIISDHRNCILGLQIKEDGHSLFIITEDPKLKMFVETIEQQTVL